MKEQKKNAKKIKEGFLRKVPLKFKNKNIVSCISEHTCSSLPLLLMLSSTSLNADQVSKIHSQWAPLAYIFCYYILCAIE